MDEGTNENIGDATGGGVAERTTIREAELKRLVGVGLSRKELVALALHLHDGLSYQNIADHQGCKKQVAARRVKNAMKKLAAAKIPVAGINRPPVKVIAVSKLGREFVSGNQALKELAGEGDGD